MVGPIMAAKLSVIRSRALAALFLISIACVSHPAPPPSKVAPSPRKAPAPVPVPPPSFYNCEAAGAPVPDDDVERVCVPYGGTPQGEAQAPITIVVFTDYQCPYCAQAEGTLKELAEDYPGKLRFYVRHHPLSFHGDAKLAAQAVVAAENQGKLWAMHDILFAQQDSLDRESLLHYAEAIGLDPKRFVADLEASATQARIEQDLELAEELGVQGTPNFFIDGRSVRGAVPIDDFKAIIDDELERANRMGPKAASGYSFYAALMKGEGKGLGKPVVPPPTPTITLGGEVFKLDLGDAPQRGAKEPKLTLVAFLDFQCAFCGRAKATLDALLQRYPDDLRIVVRHLPLPFHTNAMGAALAAVAAERQGKFWEMYDRLFLDVQGLAAQELEQHARALGLDMAKYRAAIANPKNRARVEKDLELASRFGVRGTPFFFLNGRAFGGAYPLDSFVALLDQEIERVDGLLAAGTPRAELYAVMTRDGLAKAPPQKPEARPGEPQPGEVYKAEIEGAPVRGAKHALVTVVEYSDFECPFCARVEATLDRLLQEYKGHIRVVWRNLPLPFHKRAQAAAVAAMAAGRQGKFWEMHDLLLEHQEALDASAIAGYAEQIGLDMAQFRAALADESIAKAIADESTAAARIGVRGTPSFFINGTFFAGAQPYQRFKERIDDELIKARALVRKGTPRTKVYDAIMKRARTEVERDP
jgi:protein-disulfide isomerase